MAHVARSVAARLNLNTDLAEAIALGSKVGAVPFLHIGKRTIDEWVRQRLESIDSAAGDRDEAAQQTAFAVDINGSGPVLSLPGWIESIRSPSVRTNVEAYLPWAKGSAEELAYGSGQQSYWSLTTNPYLLSTRTGGFMSQTMYGIWRHSLGASNTDSFLHEIKVEQEKRTISGDDLTHEATLVRYADDITWVIENLTEASRASSLAGTVTAYQNLARKNATDLPQPVLAALASGDSGKLYTYFIDDLVATSSSRMHDISPKEPKRETQPIIALSGIAQRSLNLMKSFLDQNIFESDRIRYRNRTLHDLTLTSLDILFEAYEGSSYFRWVRPSSPPPMSSIRSR
jgi:hypothetical protein